MYLKPWYIVLKKLLKSLMSTESISTGSSRFQEAQFQFMLTPEQATNIASNRDIRMGSKLDYLYQVMIMMIVMMIVMMMMMCPG